MNYEILYCLDNKSVHSSHRKRGITNGTCFGVEQEKNHTDACSFGKKVYPGKCSYSVVCNTLSCYLSNMGHTLFIFIFVFLINLI